VAVGWAAATGGILIAAWTGLILIADAAPFVSAGAVVLAWLFMVVAVAAQTGTEIWLAATIGAPYHPGYSLMRELERGARWLGHRYRGRGTAALLTLGPVLLGFAAVVAFAPYLLAVVSVAGHGWWLRRRYLQWEADRGIQWRQVVGAAADRPVAAQPVGSTPDRMSSEEATR
jgi:hypothetical protein